VVTLGTILQTDRKPNYSFTHSHPHSLAHSQILPNFSGSWHHNWRTSTECNGSLLLHRVYTLTSRTSPSNSFNYRTTYMHTSFHNFAYDDTDYDLIIPLFLFFFSFTLADNQLLTTSTGIYRSGKKFYKYTVFLSTMFNFRL
jgi:hypothetical protein